MQVYRLCKARWAESAFNGDGAIRYPGRWHFAGVPLVYTATGRSLAALEVLVHMEIRHATQEFVVIPAEVPDELIDRLENLPAGWNSLPPTDVSRRVGTRWARGGSSLGLQVPSVVVRGETNVLLNRWHPKFSAIEVGKPEPFAFDPRLRHRPSAG